MNTSQLLRDGNEMIVTVYEWFLPWEINNMDEMILSMVNGSDRLIIKTSNLGIPCDGVNR